MPDVIQPSDVTIKSPDAKVELKWRRDFAVSWNTRYANAQNRLAHDVLDFSEPYIPKDTGYLISTGKADGKNGLVTWSTPYAKAQYYLATRKKVVGMRGSYWAEKMKQTSLSKLVANVKAEFRR